MFPKTAHKFKIRSIKYEMNITIESKRFKPCIKQLDYELLKMSTKHNNKTTSNSNNELNNPVKSGAINSFYI